MNRRKAQSREDVRIELEARMLSRGVNPGAYYMEDLARAVTWHPTPRSRSWELVADWAESLRDYEREALFSEVAARAQLV